MKDLRLSDHPNPGGEGATGPTAGFEDSRVAGRCYTGRQSRSSCLILLVDEEVLQGSDKWLFLFSYARVQKGTEFFEAEDVWWKVPVRSLGTFKAGNFGNSFVRPWTW